MTLRLTSSSMGQFEAIRVIADGESAVIATILDAMDVDPLFLLILDAKGLYGWDIHDLRTKCGHELLAFMDHVRSLPDQER